VADVPDTRASRAVSRRTRTPAGVAAAAGAAAAGDRDRRDADADDPVTDDSVAELAADIDSAIDAAIDAADIADWAGVDAARERARSAIAAWARERGL